MLDDAVRALALPCRNKTAVRVVGCGVHKGFLIRSRSLGSVQLSSAMASVRILVAAQQLGDGDANIVLR